MALHPLELENKELVDSYCRKYPPLISELTFTNLFVWRQNRPVFFEEFKESLIFFAETGKSLVIMGNPLGPVSSTEVLARYREEVTGISRFPKKLMNDAIFPGAEISDDRDNADYVYRVEELAALAGRHYTKKRNHINRCLAEHDCSYEIISPSNTGECIAMQDRWCMDRSCTTEPGLCGEYQAILDTFRHYEKLRLTGGAIRVDGTIEAFAIGEALNPTTAVCHFEKAMASHHGLGQLINQWFAAYSLSGFTYVNREQDLGIPGLRKAKKSYHPDHMVEKVKISLKKGEKCTVCNPQQCCRHER